jgi:hypothetical protein
MLNLTKKPVYLALILALSGCGGGGSGGNSSADNSTVTLSGKVVDGYINDATVFCDSNKDGIQDTGEASTTTSGQGDFTFSPTCSTTLVSTGGTDIATGYVFKGILKAPVGATILSPLTTLLADSGLTNAQLVSALGLAEGTDLTKIDPAAPGNSAILKKTLAVQQIVQQLANLMATQSNPNAVGKLYSIVAASLARTLLASPTATLFDVNGNVNTALVTDTIQKTLDVINNDSTLKSITLAPADIASVAAQVSEQAAQFSKASDLANFSELAKTLQNPQAAPLEIPSAKTYYISPKNDSVIINSTAYTVGQFSSAGITVAGLNSIGFEYTATPGTQVDVIANVGMAIQEVGGQGRVLQVEVEQVRIERNPTSGTVVLSLTPQTNVYVYAKDNRGNELNVTVAKPSFNPVTIVNNAVTINYDTLLEKVVGNTTYNTSTFVPSQFFNLTGVFKTKFVVSSNLNVRYQDGTLLPTLNVGITNTSQSVTGPGVEGTVNIQ